MTQLHISTDTRPSIVCREGWAASWAALIGVMVPCRASRWRTLLQQQQTRMTSMIFIMGAWNMELTLALHARQQISAHFVTLVLDLTGTSRPWFADWRTAGCKWLECELTQVSNSLQLPGGLGHRTDYIMKAGCHGQTVWDGWNGLKTPSCFLG